MKNLIKLTIAISVILCLASCCDSSQATNKSKKTTERKMPIESVTLYPIGNIPIRYNNINFDYVDAQYIEFRDENGNRIRFSGNFLLEEK